MADFLGKSLSDEEKLTVAARTTFKSMANNPKTNYSWWTTFGIRNKDESQFFRKGMSALLLVCLISQNLLNLWVHFIKTIK